MSSKHAIAGAVLGLTLLALPHTAEAVVVERVVAVVAEKAILLSDLRKRAQPFLARLYTQVPEGPQRAAAESKVFSEIIQKMVDEELEVIAAARNNTVVSADEVDKALRRVARASGVPLAKLFQDVETQTGMTEVEYRQEIRRQVLEGKLLQRFIANQRITDQEVEEMFDRVRKQERGLLLYNPGWIVLRLTNSPTQEQVDQRMEEAQRIAELLRSGKADFATLAGELSEDPETKENGGDLGIRVPSTSPRALSGKYKMLNRDLERYATRLEVGEISAPFRYKDAIAIMTVLSRQPSRYTSLNAVRVELMERVQGEKLQRVKEQWLKDLRRRTHVDVRL